MRSTTWAPAKSIEQQSLEALLRIEEKLGELVELLVRDGIAYTHVPPTGGLEIIPATKVQQEQPRVHPRKRR